MVELKKGDVKVVPIEKKRWLEIKEAAEKEIGNINRSLLINERIIVLAKEMIEKY